MSREANFMQGWQQTLIDKRGGSDGQNFGALVEASDIAHLGTNPVFKAYGHARTVRAVILGAATFETLCQEALIEQGLAPTPEVIPYREVPGIDPHFLDPLPLPFEHLAADRLAAFRQRTEQESQTTTGSPVSQTTSFAFYGQAHQKVQDTYWQSRLALEDVGNLSLESLREFWKQHKNFDFPILALAGDNINAIVDVLMAMGVALCANKQRHCSPEEHTEFIIDNIDVVTAITSATRNRRKGKHPALPFNYGGRILEGDIAILKKPPYIIVNEADGKNQARWRHPSLQRGSRPRPGHCPASDHNRLRPRTEEELSAIRESLASIGLSKLVVHDSVTSTHLLVSKTLRVAKGSVYENRGWQERVVKAAA